MVIGSSTWCAALSSTGETLRSFKTDDQARRYVAAVADPNMVVVAVPSYNSRHYPWDRWQIKALASGVDRDLTRLGRSLIRAGHQTDWGDHHPYEWGGADDGLEMLELALKDPQRAKSVWSRLIAECGCWQGAGVRNLHRNGASIPRISV